jgi:membrane-bound metal-dependent hydrolase YbcI (DUF457 family)
MFIGHYAVALAAKRASPATSLGTLVAAAATLDLIWPALVLAGIERVAIAPGATVVTPLDFQYYPWSHSLLMSLVWAGLFGAMYFYKRRLLLGAAVVASLVVSHWILDAVVHRPDLPLLPGGEARIGLGLWNSLLGTLVVELALFAIGMVLYLRASAARDRIGTWGLNGLVVCILFAYGGAVLGPPPPNAMAIAWTDLGQWLFVAWAAWVDRHRRPNAALIAVKLP